MVALIERHLGQPTATKLTHDRLRRVRHVAAVTVPHRPTGHAAAAASVVVVATARLVRARPAAAAAKIGARHGAAAAAKIGARHGAVHVEALLGHPRRRHAALWGNALRAALEAFRRQRRLLPIRPLLSAHAALLHTHAAVLHAHAAVLMRAAHAPLLSVCAAAHATPHAVVKARTCAHDLLLAALAT